MLHLSLFAAMFGGRGGGDASMCVVLLCNNNTLAGFTDCFVIFPALPIDINVFARGSKAMRVFSVGGAGRPECSAVMCSQSESRLCSWGTVA